MLDLSDPNLSFKKVTIPEPLPDFQERMNELSEQDEEQEREQVEQDKKVRDELVSMGWVVEEAPPAAVLEMAQQQDLEQMIPTRTSSGSSGSGLEGDEDPLLDAHPFARTLSLLDSHRGYLLKEYENTLNRDLTRRSEIKSRLAEIAVDAGVRNAENGAKRVKSKH